MITTEKGFKKLEGGDYIPNAFYAEGCAFNGNVDLLERELDGRMAGANLLMNWDMRTPVNQRAVSSWSSGYGLDMWKAGESAVSWAGGVLTLSDTWLTQYFEYFDGFGKVHTVSVMKADGSIDSAAITPLGGESETALLFGGEIEAKTDGSGAFAGFMLRAPQGGVGIKAVKFEKGEVSTLAISAPMRWWDERLRCQRYYYAVVKGEYGHYGLAVGTSAGTAAAMIPIPVPQRLYNPTLEKFRNVTLSRKAVTGMDARCQSCCLYVNCVDTSESLEANAAYEVCGSGSVVEIAISSEL